MKSLTWTTARVKLGDLKEWDKNPVQISERDAKELAKSLSKFDHVLPYIAAAPKNGHGLPLLDGHQRKQVEIALNKVSPNTLVDVRIPSRKLTERERKEIVIRLRKNTGEFDFDKLANFFDVPDLLEWGFTEKELQLGGFEFEDTTQDAEPQIDRAAELLKVWKVKTGDLWQIGEHRLVCGDCTDAAIVARVMGGEKAAVCLTDPPYGLGAGKESGKNNYNEYKDTRENLEALVSKWLPIAREISNVVVFSPGVTNAWIYPEVNWVMCWFYGGGQLRSSWGFNCWQPFLCYGKDPSLASGNGARPDAVDMNTPSNADDLDHPCPKPLKLWNWLIERLSFSIGDLFYDPFVGSGTTLVACQNLNRRGRAIEISPAYCSVTLQRMSDAFPGIEIKRVK